MPQAVLTQVPLSIRVPWELTHRNLGSPEGVTWVQPENLLLCCMALRSPGKLLKTKQNIKQRSSKSQTDSRMPLGCLGALENCGWRREAILG